MSKAKKDRSQKDAPTVAATPINLFKVLEDARLDCDFERAAWATREIKRVHGVDIRYRPATGPKTIEGN